MVTLALFYSFFITINYDFMRDKYIYIYIYLTLSVENNLPSLLEESQEKVKLSSSTITKPHHHLIVNQVKLSKMTPTSFF